MAELASFWVGERLGPVEIASLRSFLRHGDRITVYSPGPLAGLPEGAVWRDASEVMPSAQIVRHRKSGSPALHSDMFRYQLMARTAQIWVDLDMIALRPFDFGSDWVFGHETPDEVNGAVLRLPGHSKTLQALLEYVPGTRGIPPFLTGTRRLRYRIRGLGRGLPIERWPWGAIGPRALTHFLRETGEISHALPVSAFYAVPLGQAARFLAPGGLARRDLPADAWGVHLWAKQLRAALTADFNGQIPAGSFLDLALREEL